MIFVYKICGKLCQNMGNKDNEGVYYVLNQCYGDYIIIGDVVDFVSNYCFGFIWVYVLQ